MCAGVEYAVEEGDVLWQEGSGTTRGSREFRSSGEGNFDALKSKYVRVSSATSVTATFTIVAKGHITVCLCTHLIAQARDR